jgi:cytochrome c oxidase accessory protein FixG
VDCTMCVQVCPTGIDIRDGLQYECIACAACIDACDGVMDKVGYPRGLIRYTTQNALEGKPARILRGRTYVYAALLTLIFVAGLAGLLLRNPLSVDVIRDRNALYRETETGLIENVYNLRILNKDQRDHVLVLGIEGTPGMTLVEGPTQWLVKAGEVYTAAVSVAAPRESVSGGHDIRFTVAAKDQPRLEAASRARFIAP